MTAGDFEQTLKMTKLDIFSLFVSIIIHDFEHPGYQNQFIVRTKHPIAGRYSDISVLEQHHLAAAFTAMLRSEQGNIMHNLPWGMYRESRQMIIEIVLNSDISKHFSLMTMLKTKLGNDFPTEAMEDRVLFLSAALRTADSFKVVRDGRTVFFKWMDNMFDEFFKQGDMERAIELPISKFMDRDQQQNKEKAYLNYIQVVCRPLLSTFMILGQDEEMTQAIIKDGVDKNKKALEQRIDENSGK